MNAIRIEKLCENQTTMKVYENISKLSIFACV